MSRIALICTFKEGGKKVQKPIFLEEGSTVIGDERLEGCMTLIDVVIPEGVTEIYECAFRECKNLTHVYFPNSLQGVAAWAFEGCEKLKKVTLTKNVEMHKNAFPKDTEIVLVA